MSLTIILIIIIIVLLVKRSPPQHQTPPPPLSQEDESDLEPMTFALRDALAEDSDDEEPVVFTPMAPAVIFVTHHSTVHNDWDPATWPAGAWGNGIKRRSA